MRSPDKREVVGSTPTAATNFEEINMPFDGVGSSQLLKDLTAARAKVEKGWVQGALYARNRDGVVNGYCAQGAIMFSVGVLHARLHDCAVDDFNRIEAAEKALADVIAQEHPWTMNGFKPGFHAWEKFVVVNFNNDVWTTQEMMLAVFDRAIAKVIA